MNSKGYRFRITYFHYSQYFWMYQLLLSYLGEFTIATSNVIYSQSVTQTNYLPIGLYPCEGLDLNPCCIYCFNNRYIIISDSECVSPILQHSPIGLTTFFLTDHNSQMHSKIFKCNSEQWFCHPIGDHLTRRNVFYCCFAFLYYIPNKVVVYINMPRTLM